MVIEVDNSHNCDWVMMLTAYFDETRAADWPTQSVRLAERLAAELQVEPTHFGISPAQPKPKGLRSDYSYRWLPKNVARLWDHLDEGNARVIEVMARSSASEYLIDSDFYLEVHSCLADCIRGLVYVQVASHLMKMRQIDTHRWFSTLIEELDRIADVRYGFVQPMTLSAMPSMFPIGVSGAGSSPAELMDIDTWVRNLRDHRLKARNLYWGNLITSSHCIANFAGATKEITDVVGADNVVILPEDKVFFTLPLPMEDLKGLGDNAPYRQMKERLAAVIRFMAQEAPADAMKTPLDLSGQPVGADTRIAIVNLGKLTPGRPHR
ncbi:MAG: hypothetical protein ACM3ZU_03335 [Bacteroidota bacterium]